ncbi:MAG: class I SAM-dependent rRNA methyltransferase [Ignavibacteriaceae bacterium]|nr:class I SAM-dependent rRNA methyltransferase [Ignavibacteriaceae bacterium]
MKKVILKRNEENRIVNGHLWVFSNEIFKIQDEPENGDLVEVYDAKNILLGMGFFNKSSLIAIRMLSRDLISDLELLLRERMKSAYELRKTFYPNREAFRMVFSESDFLPGLIIDKYNKTFVLQIYSAGMEKNLELITKILKEDFSAENILTKHEPYFRKLEGLSEENSVLFGNIGNEIISDGSLKFEIDFSQGQKTGFYFDQSDNRFFIEKISSDKTVLDAFCNSGGFGLHALKAGANDVTFVDSSANEIEKVKKNIELNNLSGKTEFVVYDVFDFLEREVANNKKYDLVFVDPPAFAKNKKTLKTAEKGYEKLNRLALQLISNGGFLITSSCSFHLKKSEFISVIAKAAQKANKTIQLIHFNEASFDHPKLPMMEETSYLKFAVFKILG